jgi:tetratricopeptide (TPR) repeat protein
MLSRAAALLGRACLQLGQFQPAEAAFGSALQLCMANIEGSSPAEIQEIRSACDVGISEAYSGRAQLTSMGRAEMRGDILAAAESAKAILSIAPRCMTALSTLASALAATAQWNQAAAFCVTYCLVPQEAAGSDSWPPPPGSLCTAQAALLMGPGPSQVYVTSLVATGRGMEARIAMSALLCRAPGLGWCRQLQALVTRIDKLRADANTKAAAKEHAQSAQLLTEALDSMLQLMPGSPAASGILCARSAVMVSMGRWQDARSDAKEALGLSPALPEALLACARAAAGQGGDLQDAIQGYEVYLSSHPEDQAAAAELRDVKAKLQSQSRRDAKAQESAKGPATTSSPKSKANSAKTPAKGRRNSFIPQPKAAAPTPAKTSSSRTRSQYATDDTHLRAVTTPGKAKTLYEVLGVNQDADSVKVKKAYRALALRYHPDKSKAIDAAERFKGLNEAYSVLSSPGKKNQYDQELAMRYMAVN